MGLGALTSSGTRDCCRGFAVTIAGAPESCGSQRPFEDEGQGASASIAIQIELPQRPTPSRPPEFPAGISPEPVPLQPKVLAEATARAWSWIASPGPPLWLSVLGSDRAEALTLAKRSRASSTAMEQYWCRSANQFHDRRAKLVVCN